MKVSLHQSRFAGFFAGVSMMLLTGSLAISPPSAADEPGESGTVKPPSHMSEALRASIRKVVVLPTTSPASGSVSGSYRQETPGLIAGADKGGRIGQGVSTDVGPVTVRFPIPILTLPGMIFGGLSGSARRRIQDFRDALTKDLADSASSPLSNDALASDVFWSIRNVPTLKPKVLSLETPLPADTEAVLYVSLTEVGINVEKDIAIITTTARATLRRLSDGVDVFERFVEYQDTDTLENWTKNDKAAWRAYANYARHYIGREISAAVFERIELNHTLEPAETETVKQHKRNRWLGMTKSLSPTLAWNIELLGGNSYGSWADGIDQSAISYDVEVYDAIQRVYYANRVAGNRHTIAVELEPCRTYRWTVRPNYKVGRELKFGEWMRLDSDAISGRGNVGSAASVAAAYIQDFAALQIECGRR